MKDLFNYVLTLGCLYAMVSLFFYGYAIIQQYVKTKSLTFEDKKIVLYIGIIAIASYFLTYDILLLCVALSFGIVCLYFILLFLIAIYFKITQPNFKKSYTLVDTINASGFTINKGGRIITFNWADIKSIRINSEKMDLVIKGKTNLTLGSDIADFFKLLQKIPSGIPDFDYQFRNQFFSTLITCEACGNVGVYENKCYSCGTDVWNEKEMVNEFSSKNEYVKTCQLYNFATMDKEEKFNNFILEDSNFPRDPNWKPIVTRSDVLHYSKENYWDEKDY